ncbi:MAG: BatA domain-containing protein [Planctomycetota bacterium]
MSSWGFQQPLWLVGGLLLAALPILIHWLSRRRVRVVEWAAFEFLLGAQRRDQRRVQLENWLLLALRCLLVALLAILVARPWLRSGWQGTASSSQATHHFLVLDDTQSMQAMSGNESSWESARQALIEFCRSQAQRASGDSLTLWLLSQPDEPRLNAWPLYAEQLPDLLARIESLTPTDTGTPLGSGLSVIVPQLLARTSTGPRTLTILTDLRAVDWESRTGETDGSLPLESLGMAAREGVAIALWDAASREAQAEDLAAEANVQIVGITAETLQVEQVPCRFHVQLRSAGRRATSELELRLSIDDSPIASQRIESLAAGEEQTVEFEYTFLPRATEGGTGRWSVVEAHVVAVRPERDNRLLADDRRSAAVWVEPPLEVLLVEGPPSGKAGRAESFFLAPALAPAASTASFQPRVVPAIDWDARSLDNIAVIYLVNVPRLPPEVVERLAVWVRRGGGLGIIAGEQTEPSWHADGLGERGVGLAPLQLKTWTDHSAAARWETWSIVADGVPEQSGLEGLQGAEQPLLRAVRLGRWWDATLAPVNDSNSGSKIPSTIATSAPRESARPRLLATLASGAPLAAWQTYGAGRVLELGCGVTEADSNWISEPAFVVFFQPVTEWLAGARRQVRSEVVGEPLRWPLDLTQFQTTATLKLPRSGTLSLAAREPVESTSSGWMFQSPRTEKAGVYYWELTSMNGQRYPFAVAVQSQSREGELQRVSESTLRGELQSQEEATGVPLAVVRGGSIAAALPGAERREFAASLGWFLLAGLLAESWWAWQVGRRR